jgi:hypothetical protein
VTVGTEFIKTRVRNMTWRAGSRSRGIDLTILDIWIFWMVLESNHPVIIAMDFKMG